MFGKKYVPLASLIQWQHEGLTGSLLRKGISNKDAVSIFKRIQVFMGDRGAELAGKPDVVRYIIERGIKCAPPSLEAASLASVTDFL